ncbi:Protein polyglycylase TTLL10 [Hondaea fermentalgiana]|uniref:Protein polyglycylase TTLL10 n=1 Tax=Hondaea fermentalgiana TaxID=2315210 RepID=A0A2R5GPG2_9STRA|nr:Protein polyglycylase TTLL10 [Hondaea fermentalgiana]|eukprot:GBG32757.1 Protein polyglycylase TTLL10 [Hondaea fermentalgiana]
MGLVRFRDVVSLVCLCAVALLALDGRVACENGPLQRFEPSALFAAVEADDAAQERQAEHDRELGRLHQAVADLQSRVEALQRENARLNKQPDLELDETVEQIKQVALQKQRASLRHEEPQESQPLADSPSDLEAPEETDEVSLTPDGYEENPVGNNNNINNNKDSDYHRDRDSAPVSRANVDGVADLDVENVLEEVSEQTEDDSSSDEIVGEDAGALAGLVVDRSEEERGESEPLVEAEDGEDEDDEEDEPVLVRPSELGFSVLENGKFELLPQVSNKLHKTFRVVNTKFISLFHAWEHAGWRHRYDPTAPVALYVTKPISKVPGSTGKMISQISKSSCIGGTKGAQLRCKVALANKHGCEYSALKLSPPQYNLREKVDCERFFKVAMAPENAEKLWIGKDGGSYHGKNIKIYKGLKYDIKKRYGRCTKDKKGSAGYIMMDYIANPQLIEGRKFDLRTYLLIASTKPFIVFYHKGFIRRSSKAYSGSSFSRAGHITNHKVQDNTEGHFWSFAQLGDYLTQEAHFPANFMDDHFRHYVKRATNFVFQAARMRLKRRPGAFMLFGLDWMIDADQNIHFLEANGNPTISDYPGTNLGPTIWNEMTELITAVHREPSSLGPDLTVASEYAYGGWEMVFNEAEEFQRGDVYNACADFGAV